ncbi:MAG: PHP domain-containing protein [Clostridiales bacterium]|nr:PHP domain-containing protein [Clostridiales bacterium]
MVLSKKELLERLNCDKLSVRLDALRRLCELEEWTEAESNGQFEDVNNHIHTKYSFSPYYPAAAVWMSKKAGLSTAGIVDHDSISGAKEFIEAGKIASLPVTIGTEVRASMKSTPIYGRRINNPDQDSVIYMTLQGIPHTQIDKVDAYLAPYRAKRDERNRKMTKVLQNMFSPYGIDLCYDGDVIPLSRSCEGGSVTERHILFALSLNMIKAIGKGEKLVSFLKNKVELNVSSKIEDFLSDEENPHYEYDLLGLLKGELVAKFYIDADEECPPVREIIAFAKEIGAISAYAYLGDVGDSVTGDKRAQKFEDDYLPLLFDTLADLGFDAVTYMPSRNTPAQLANVRMYCDKYGLLQISGEDINSPRQKFVCEKMRSKEFANLVSAAWMLIGHENEATKCLENAITSDKTIKSMPDISERVAHYEVIGRKL